MGDKLPVRCFTRCAKDYDGNFFRVANVDDLSAERSESMSLIRDDRCHAPSQKHA